MKRPWLALIVIGTSLVFWTGIFKYHQYRRQDVNLQFQKKNWPLYTAKTKQTISGIETESPKESIELLYKLNEFYSPGPGLNEGTLDIPVRDDQEEKSTINTILSNRRFRKVFAELEKMDKSEASRLVKQNLLTETTNYLNLLNARMQKDRPIYHVPTNHFGATNMESLLGPGVVFEIGQPPGKEKEEMLLGARLKLLSLVWISGMLRMTDNREPVEQIARLGMQQRAWFYDDKSGFYFVYRADMLRTASLYVREILSAGLIGVEFSDEKSASDAMKKAGISWKERTVTAYDAALTEFDVPSRSGITRPDLSKGVLRVKYVSPLADTNFDMLLQEIHFK
jgi:DNA-binding XRE family transcriptional regulator